jgi:hypothetical protein
MPQVSPRLPNSSGGGEAPQFTLRDESWEQIKSLTRDRLTDAQTKDLRIEIDRVVSNYLKYADAAISAPIFDRRRDQFHQIGRTIGTLTRQLEELEVGDMGDFGTALLERNLSHPDLEHNELGKVEAFRRRTREYSDLVRAAAIASENARKEALASAQAGLQPVRIWDILIRDMAGVWNHFNLPVAARKDDLEAISDFVRVIDVVQSNLDEKYRRHSKNPLALSIAVSRAIEQTDYSVSSVARVGPICGFDCLKPGQQHQKKRTTG